MKNGKSAHRVGVTNQLRLVRIDRIWKDCAVCKGLHVQNLETLVDDNVMWRYFLAKKEGKGGKAWRGQTARSNMVSLKKFLDYLLKDSRRNNFSIPLVRET